MAASTPGVFNPQQFTDLGGPLVGGRLYTYTYGTTSHKTAYTDVNGLIAHTYTSDGLGGQYIALNARGELPAPLYLVTGSYDIALKRADGTTVWTRRADPTADVIQDLPTAVGASLIGVSDAGGYFNGATVEALLQEIANPRGRFQLDGVNVLKYILPSEWANIFAYTSATDLATTLQAALIAEPNLIFPNGRFCTSTKLIPRTDAKIRGVNRRGTQLYGLSAITLLEYGINSIDCTVENIWFCGSGTTGIAVATTAGTFHDYLIRPHITGCDFSWELAYGINATLIYLTLEKSTFGNYGTAGSQPAAGTSTMTAIKAYVNVGNLPNLNRVSDCNFNAGSLTAPAVDISGGIGWTFTDCDFSFGGVAMRVANVPLLKFRGTCWFEGNNATNGIVELGATTTNPDFCGINVSNNTCSAFIRYATGSTSGVNLYDSEIGLNSPSYVMTDTTTLVNTLPGNGSVRFYGNHVTGGNAANKLVTGVDFRGGKAQARATVAGNTTATAVLYASSDPGATIVRNSAGNADVFFTHPLGTDVNNIVIPCPGSTSANANRYSVITLTQIRVQLFTDASVATDGVFSLVIYGS